MRIPFSIKHRTKIESGEFKVIYLSYDTEEESPARIICWDRHNKHSIVALISNTGGYERVTVFQEEGIDNNNPHQGTLLIVTSEKEKLTPFEVAVKSWMGVAEDIVIDDSWVKNCAKELLSLARKELQPEIDAEIEKAYKNANKVQYEKGMADVLKDAVEGTIHHVLNAHYIVTNQKQLNACLRSFPEGTNVKIFIFKSKEESK